MILYIRYSPRYLGLEGFFEYSIKTRAMFMEQLESVTMDPKIDDDQRLGMTLILLRNIGSLSDDIIEVFGREINE